MWLVDKPWRLLWTPDDFCLRNLSWCTTLIYLQQPALNLNICAAEKLWTCQNANYQRARSLLSTGYPRPGTQPVILRQNLVTELKLESPLPSKSRLWLCITLLLSSLYLYRNHIQTIPPEDHVAIALFVCFLLTQFWISIEKTSIEISLSNNRCWLRYHRLGRSHALSLPASQIHSATLEYEESPTHTTAPNARIALVTSLGMIPVNQDYQENPQRLHDACERINRFLQSQTQLLQAWS